MKKLFLLIAFCILSTIGVNAVVWPGDTGGNPIAGLEIYEEEGGIQVIKVTSPGALSAFNSSTEPWSLLGTDACKKLKIIGEVNSNDISVLDNDVYVSNTWSRFNELDMSEMSSPSGGSELSFLKGWMGLTKVTFSKKISAIPAYLFEEMEEPNRPKLKEVIIPDLDGTATIGDHAFCGLSDLEAVTIGKGVTTIGTGESGGVFMDCSNLQSVDMRGGTVIGPLVFQNCTSLTEVALPEGLTEIGELAFEGASFSSIRLPNSLKVIRGKAFENCNNITEIVIPATVEELEKWAFNKCDNLRDVYVLGSNTKCPVGTFNKLDINSFQYTADGDVDYTDWHGTNTAPDGNGNRNPIVLHVSEDVYDQIAHPLLKYAAQIFEIIEEYNCPDIGVNDNNNSIPQEARNKFNAIITAMNSDRLVQNVVYAVNEKSQRDNYFVKDSEGKYYLKSPSNFFNYSDEGGCIDRTTNYAGWQEFLLAVKVPKQEEWPDTRMVDDKWYSMCFPFPMSETQLGNAFGNTVEVCEFSGVDVQTKGNKKLITLKFKKRVKQTVAHKAYMIHPGFHNASSGQGTVTNTIVGIKLANDFNKDLVAKSETEMTDDEKAIINGLRGALEEQKTVITADGIEYTFKGSYFANEKLPAYTYYWWPGGEGWDPSFYKTMTKDKIVWTPYTSVVLCSGDNGASNAKMVYFIKGEDDIFGDMTGIATAIDKVVANEDVNKNSEGRVMNLNGQVVGNSLTGLPSGVYIVNGKKYVVR